MPTIPENPFASYQPPKTADFIHALPYKEKIEITKLKAERLTAEVESELSQGEESTSFFNGVSVYTKEYDCATLEPFIQFKDPKNEVAFLMSAVMVGIQKAAKNQKVKGSLPLEFRYCFKDDEPRVVEMNLSVRDTEE